MVVFYCSMLTLPEYRFEKETGRPNDPEASAPQNTQHPSEEPSPTELASLGRQLTIDGERIRLALESDFPDLGHPFAVRGAQLLEGLDRNGDRRR